MSTTELNWIANFIWGIADDVLRDVYVRGKYRDVILPMVVIRRLDAVLEPTAADVRSMKANLDKAGVVHQVEALRSASKQAFYNASPFTLNDLRSRCRRTPTTRRLCSVPGRFLAECAGDLGQVQVSQSDTYAG